MRILCDELASEVVIDVRHVVKEVRQAVREVRQEAVEGQASISRPQRTRNMPARLQECVITSDDVVNEESLLVHYAF